MISYTGLTRPPPSSDDEESPFNRVCVSPLILELVVLVLLLVVVFMMINALSFSLLCSLSLKICDRISRVVVERYEHRSFRGFRWIGLGFGLRFLNPKPYSEEPFSPPQKRRRRISTTTERRMPREENDEGERRDFDSAVAA